VFYDAEKQQLMGKENKNSLLKTLDRENQYYKLFYENTAAMLLIDPSTGSIVDANKSACKFYGYSKKVLTSMNIQDINTLTEEQIAAEMKKTQSLKQNYFQFEHRLANGNIKLVEVYSGRIVVNNKPLLSSIIHDISDRKISEEKLKNSEKRYYELFNHISSGVAIYKVIDGGRDFIFMDFNRAGELIDGNKKKELIGKSIYKVRPNINEFGILEVFRRVFATGISERFLDRFYIDKQLERWYDNYVYRLPSGDIVAVFDDITDRKKAEESLKESEELFKSIVENNSNLVTLTDEQGIVTYLSPQCEDVIGYPASEIIGLIMPDFIHPDDKNKCQHEWEQVVLHGKELRDLEYRIFDSKNKVRWLSHNARMMKANGKVIGMQNTITNITARKQSEEKILKNQYYLSKAQEIGLIGTWELDIQKNILIWTDEIYKIFGVPLGTKITYEIFLNCVHPDDRDYVNEKWIASLKNKPYDIEHRITLNNEVKWVREKAEIQFDSNGKPIIAIGFTQDITERKQTEIDLQNRMQSNESLMQHMVGREIRMSELKKEINELLVKSGQKKRYFKT